MGILPTPARPDGLDTKPAESFRGARHLKHFPPCATAIAGRTIACRRMTPRISVLISTYNNRRFVEKKLREARRQSIFDQAEFLFLETASPERERELLQPFCATHPNCRLLATDDHRTLYAAWNLGWDAARAPLLCYSNMDDAMHPRLLEHVATALERRGWDACSVLIAKQLAEDAALDTWSRSRMARLPLSLRPGPFTAWRADLKERFGQFDGRFAVVGDRDFWSRLIARRMKFGLVPKVLYLYTKSPEQLSKGGYHSTRREQEEKLLREKPYPIRWSMRMRNQIVVLRYLRRLFPAWFIPNE